MGGLIARYAIGLLTQPDSSSSSTGINVCCGNGGSSGGDGSSGGCCESDGNTNSGSSRCWQVAGLKPCLYISIATPTWAAAATIQRRWAGQSPAAAAAAGQLINAQHAF